MRVRPPGFLRGPAGMEDPGEQLPADISGSGRRTFRVRWRSAVHRRVRRRLDFARRQPVRRLARDGALPHLPVRGCRLVHRRQLPHPRRSCPSRGAGKVLGRLRGDGHRHDATGPFRRLRQPRGRRPLRVLPPAGAHRGLQDAPGQLRLQLRGLLRRHGDTTRPVAPQRCGGRVGLGDGGLFLGRRGRDGEGSLRPAHGADRRCRLGALARLGPRQDGPAPRAGLALPTGDLGRRRTLRRVPPRRRRRGLRCRAGCDRRHRGRVRAVRRHPRGQSSTATRCRSPISPSASPEPDRRHGPARHGHGPPWLSLRCADRR